MEIEVKLFATLRDYLPKGSDRFSCKLVIEGRGRSPQEITHWCGVMPQFRTVVERVRLSDRRNRPPAVTICDVLSDLRPRSFLDSSLEEVRQPGQGGEQE